MGTSEQRSYTMNYTEFNAYIDTLADEYKLSGHDDFADYCHEVADGSQHVIYWGMAWELVNMIRECDYSLFDDAQLALENDSIDDLNKAMSMMAYEVIYQTLMLELNTRHDSEAV